MVTLDDVADELYGLDPADFVAVRKARVAQARNDGDRDLATAIGQLRKPTVVGWTINLLARQLSSDVAALLELGAALRIAQQTLSGSELRALTAQRQAVVRTLADRAVELAAERGQRLPETAQREVGQSLHAALSDPTVGEQVRTGRLVTAISYSGFGPTGLAVVDPPAPPPPSKKKGDAGSLRESAQRELADADEAVAEARQAADAGQREEDAAADKLTAIDTRLADLRDELERAEQERRFALGAQKSAADRRHSLDREVQRAEKRALKARNAIDGLD